MSTQLVARRREVHAATAKSFETDGMKQVLLAYRADRHASVATDFKFKPGFLYTQVRAISARINQNFDGWPSGELKKAYRTFIGKPIFVNHQNFEPKKARGKVVAARYVEAGDDKYIETVMEIDAKRFPKLAKEIREGGLDSVSMGVEAGFTICSYCGNKAVDVPDFCEHVKYHKGQKLGKVNEKTGAVEPVVVYERCYKLGFFELSYVFDPADETAVVSRVISANYRNGSGPTGRELQAEILPNDMPYADMPTEVPPTEIPPTGMMPTAALENRIERLAWDYRRIDTLPPEEEEDHSNHLHKKVTDFFNPDKFLDDLDRREEEKARKRQKHAWGEIEAPEDVDTLRDEDDDDNDDFKHYVDSPKELRGPDLDQTKRLDRDQEQQGLDTDRRVEDVEDVGFPQQGVVMPNRNGRRRAASRRYAEDLPPELAGPGGGGDPSLDPSLGAGPDDQGGPPPDDGSGGGGQSDEELIAEAEHDLQMAEQTGAGGAPDDGSDDGSGGDFPPDDSGDDGSGLDDEDPEESDQGPPPDDDGGDEGSDLPPWLQGGGDSGDDAGPPPPPEHLSRRNGNSRSSNRNKRRKGAPQMSLADRTRVAAAQRPRNHYADNSGHFDGGPYGEDNQGEQEEVFLSQTPGTESVAVPTPGDGTISNSENNLVASLRQRINARNAEQRRDLIAYEQITGRRISAEAVETPDEVNPTVDDSASEELTGNDFESLGEPPVETQPKDASVHAFRAFDAWLRQTTGKTAAQHGNGNFIRRSAARYCQAKGWDPSVMFPTLGNVLREARSNEGTTRRANVKRTADEKLEVAAPQDRIDVEAPVSDTTDADAQASQFDLTDFGGNASDGKADPELSVDSQIWAPGEGEGSVKSSNRKADGITAVRYAEAYIRAGLAPNTSEEKWKIAGLAQTMRLGTIRDRIALLDAVNTVHQASNRRTAGVNRGAGSSVPPGFGQRQLTAGQAANSANDIATDSAMFLK